MFVIVQIIILKSVLFKNLMWAFIMYFLKLSYFQKYMWAVDQKHNTDWSGLIIICMHT